MTTLATRSALAVAALALPLVFAAPVFAGGTHDGHGNQSTAGKQGNASNVTRTINVVMYDNYYEPEDIAVKDGETVRFVITNKGALVHEFNIGTPDSHVAHAPEMQMMVDHGILEADRIDWEAAKKMQKEMGHGMHDAPNSVLLEPGKSGEIIWQFPDQSEIEFACNVPGHYDAGMAGTIELTH